MRPLVLLLGALLLAGCASNIPAGPSLGSSTGEPASGGAPIESTPPPSTGSPSSSSASTSSPSGQVESAQDRPWNGTWVVLADECSFCTVSRPERVALVDPDGQALLVDTRASAEGSGIVFTNGTERWSPIVAPVLLELDAHQGGREVYRVQDRTVAADDWARLAQDLRDGLATARDPRPNDGPAIADGGYRILLAEGRRVTLDDNHDGGGGWADVAAAMDEVRAGFGQGP